MTHAPEIDMEQCTCWPAIIKYPFFSCRANLIYYLLTRIFRQIRHCAACHMVFISVVDCLKNLCHFSNFFNFICKQLHINLVSLQLKCIGLLRLRTGITYNDTSYNNPVHYLNFKYCVKRRLNTFKLFIVKLLYQFE